MKWTVMMVVLVGALALTGCKSEVETKEEAAPQSSGSSSSSGSTSSSGETEDFNANLELLRTDIESVAARSEHDAESIEVQHLLVAHKDAGLPGVTRSLEEAEALTADLYAQIVDGADYDALIKANTDDSHPGIYAMTSVGAGDPHAGIFARDGMVPAFGDVGWRLEVGEVGVAPHNSVTSPYGWHIILRTK